jgi:hypothetical protein
MHLDRVAEVLGLDTLDLLPARPEFDNEFSIVLRRAIAQILD